MKSKEYYENLWDKCSKSHSTKRKKNPIKSNHKHNYQDCLLHSKVPRYTNKNEFTDVYVKAKYCTICGKISDIMLFEFDKIGLYAILVPQTKEYMTKKYPNIDIFSVDDVWKDKYVTLVTQIDK